MKLEPLLASGFGLAATSCQVLLIDQLDTNTFHHYITSPEPAASEPAGSTDS